MSSASERNRELVAAAFDAFQRGDAEALNARLHPHIHVHISDELANSGTWRGHEGFWESVGSWLEAWDEYRADVRGLDAVDEEHVIAEVHQRATGRASGVPVELMTWFMFEVRDGLCTRYELHASEEAARRSIDSPPQ